VEIHTDLFQFLLLEHHGARWARRVPAARGFRLQPCRGIGHSWNRRGRPSPARASRQGAA